MAPPAPDPPELLPIRTAVVLLLAAVVGVLAGSISAHLTDPMLAALIGLLAFLTAADRINRLISRS